MQSPAALSGLVFEHGTIFVCDTYVNPDPSPTEIANMTVMAAEQVRRFGIEPKVALLSHSNFGTYEDPPSAKMRQALAEIMALSPDFEVDGEMHSDAALSEEIRNEMFGHSRLTGSANLLIMPTMDAANIAFNMAKVLGNGLPIGPMLLGMSRPVHVLTASATSRRILNLTAIAIADVQDTSPQGVLPSL